MLVGTSIKCISVTLVITGLERLMLFIQDGKFNITKDSTYDFNSTLGHSERPADSFAIISQFVLPVRVGSFGRQVHVKKAQRTAGARQVKDDRQHASVIRLAALNSRHEKEQCRMFQIPERIINFEELGFSIEPGEVAPVITLALRSTSLQGFDNELDAPSTL
ncbi:uncharacterized protein V6R79_019796 [Siganus canaliculatus]